MSGGQASGKVTRVFTKVRVSFGVIVGLIVALLIVVLSVSTNVDTNRGKEGREKNLIASESARVDRFEKSFNGIYPELFTKDSGENVDWIVRDANTLPTVASTPIANGFSLTISTVGGTRRGTPRECVEVLRRAANVNAKPSDMASCVYVTSDGKTRVKLVSVGAGQYGIL